MKTFSLCCLSALLLISAVASNSTKCSGTCDDPEFSWNEDTCSCVNDETAPANKPCAIRCKSGYKLSYLNGKCFCTKVECESWQRLDEERNCVCRSTWDCKRGYVWDDIHCNCRPIKPSCSLVCVEPQKLDEFNCECIDALCSKTCPSGYTTDYSNCTTCEECECKSNETTPTVPTPSPSCAITCLSDNFTLNYEDCKCDCKKSCSDDLYLDDEQCRCINCEKECPEGFTLSQHNCSCWDCDCIPSTSDKPFECK